MENRLINIMCRISETSGRLRVVTGQFCNLENAQIIAEESANALQAVNSDLIQIIAALNSKKKEGQ